MKRKLAFTVCLLLAVLLMSSAAFAKSHGKKAPEYDENDFENFKTITTTGVLDEDLEFVVVPDGYNYHPTEHQGTIEYVYYDTDVYEDGKTYKKFCVVYLPYGYDPEDKETKYNVLYFQHGNSQSPKAIWERNFPTANTKLLMDNMFDPDHQLLDPYIIINPTYYFDADENTMYMNPPDAPAGDGRYPGIKGNYYKEVIEDLIPQVESRYNVYCEDFSPEGIKASRDHRAWAGYSRGSACTWYMMHHNFEYFGYFVPMSCPIFPAEASPEAENDQAFAEQPEGVGQFTPADAYDYIYETIEANPDLDFFLLATSGGDKDGAGQQMIPQMQEFYSHPETFSFGLDPEEDHFYFAMSEFDHMDAVMPFTLYNARDILFR